MSVLVVGISHNSAPVSLLERVALDEDAHADAPSSVIWGALRCSW